MSDASVREFWQQRALDPANNDSEVTHRDIWQRWLEIESIRRCVRPSDRLLDIGCGAGYTTKLIAPAVSETVGVDYSDEMIARARRSSDPALRLRFEVGDVLTLAPAQFGLFDVAVSSRCLINLQDWTLQQRAIQNIAGVLKPGGRLVFVEGLADGRERLNTLRQQVGLEAMPKVWHNVDFVEAALLPFLDPLFTVIERRHFGVYDFIARVVHPLMVAPEAPRYDARINEIAARLALDRQDCGDLSRVIFLVLEKLPA
jgi:SAM-dependent methyltransferase